LKFELLSNMNRIWTGQSLPSQTRKTQRFEERNNFPCRNFRRFTIDFELKFKKASRVWIWIEFDGILIGTSRFDEIWLKGSWLHLDDTSTHEKNLEFQIYEFLDLLQEFDLNLFEFLLGFLRIWLTNGFGS
jgi:hypothetical protein